MDLYRFEYCLYCDNPIQPSLGWRDFLFGPKEAFLCPKCEGKLERIEEPACRICGRPGKGMDRSFFKDGLCYDCLRWESSGNWKGVLTKNLSLFEYNPFMAEIIARYKYRGDYILAKIFAEDIKRGLDNLEHDVIVPIPLSPERLKERGFNQAEALAKEAGAETQPLLLRKHTEKQSKKSREERIHLPQVFEVKKDGEKWVRGKRILLLDDIYTTGSTLRHAALALIQKGVKSVSSLTLARG